MKKKLLALTPLLIALLSCSSGSSAGENYTVTQGSLLIDQRIYQVTPVWQAENFERLGVTVDWQFSGQAVLFQDDCPLTAEDIKSLSVGSISLSFLETQNERQACGGTDFFTYTPIDDRSNFTVNVDSTQYSGKVALFYGCNLQEYVVTPKDGGDPFSIYLQASSLWLTVASVSDPVE